MAFKAPFRCFATFGRSKGAQRLADSGPFGLKLSGYVCHGVLLYICIGEVNPSYTAKVMAPNVLASRSRTPKKSSFYWISFFWFELTSSSKYSHCRTSAAVSGRNFSPWRPSSPMSCFPKIFTYPICKTGRRHVCSRARLRRSIIDQYLYSDRFWSQMARLGCGDRQSTRNHQRHLTINI